VGAGGAGDPNLVLLVRAANSTVTDPAVADAGLALTNELASEQGVEQVVSYWSLGFAPPLASDAAHFVRRTEDGGRFPITVRGKPVAVLLPCDDVDEIPLSERTWRQLETQAMGG
jgi:prevent-host-death family protein